MRGVRSFRGSVQQPSNLMASRLKKYARQVPNELHERLPDPRNTRPIRNEAFKSKLLAKRVVPQLAEGAHRRKQLDRMPSEQICCANLNNGFQNSLPLSKPPHVVMGATATISIGLAKSKACEITGWLLPSTWRFYVGKHGSICEAERKACEITRG